MFASEESTSSTVATLNKGTNRILRRSKLLNPSVGSAGFAHRTSILVTHPVSMILTLAPSGFPRPAVAPPRRKIFMTRGASEPALNIYSFLSRPTFTSVLGIFKLNLVIVSNIL